MMEVYFNRIRCSSTDEKVFSPKYRNHGVTGLWVGTQSLFFQALLESERAGFPQVSSEALGRAVHTSSSWVASLPAFPPSGLPRLSQCCRLFQEQRKMNQSLVSFAVYLFTTYSAL